MCIIKKKEMCMIYLEVENESSASRYRNIYVTMFLMVRNRKCFRNISMLNIQLKIEGCFDYYSYSHFSG